MDEMELSCPFLSTHLSDLFKQIHFYLMCLKLLQRFLLGRSQAWVEVFVEETACSCLFIK